MDSAFRAVEPRANSSDKNYYSFLQETRNPVMRSSVGHDMADMASGPILDDRTTVLAEDLYH